MKRKSLLWILGALLVTAVALNVSLNLSANKTERTMMLANVEALAVGENTAPYNCYKSHGAYQKGSWYLACNLDDSYCKRMDDYPKSDAKYPCSQVVQ